MALEESGVPVDDPEYELVDDEEMMVTHGMFGSKNPPNGRVENRKPTTN